MIFFKVFKKDKLEIDLDYIFEKIIEYNKVKDYLIKRIEGTWKIAFVDLTLKELRILLDSEWKEYTDVYIYCKKDILSKIAEEYPKLFKYRSKSKWETYLETIKDYEKILEKKVISEIYSRTRGEVDEVKATLEELSSIYPDKDEIGIRELNAVLVKEDTVFAKDVIITLLMYKNSLVPKKGHPLSSFKYKDYRDLYYKLIEIIDKRIAFFSLRKYVKELCDFKLKYLKNEELDRVTDSLLSVIDVYSLNFLLLLFETSNYNQVEVIFDNYERRCEGNANSIVKEILNEFS